MKLAKVISFLRIHYKLRCNFGSGETKNKARTRRDPETVVCVRTRRAVADFIE